MTDTATETVDTTAATEPAGWDAAIAASAEAQAEPPKTVRRLVRWKLEAPAMADLGRELAQESADLEAIKAERKSANARFREDIDETETKIKGLTEAIRSGMGTKEVEVRERFDPDTGRTELVGLDGVIYEAAEMNGSKQLTLADAVNGHGPAVFDTSADFDEPEEDTDEESPDLEDRLDRALAEADDDEPSAGDVVIADPQAVLDAASSSEDVTAADAPTAKRSRKAKG